VTVSNPAQALSHRPNGDRDRFRKVSSDKVIIENGAQTLA